ncbi:ATP-binding protein [Mycolicibacterium komossense]|uniref:ATP-binding protein n=2 Tax=Mycolicibacterium komossense TaxID=1779 RepID=A0ABT3CEK3_9MYCO|nr:ATP-binding protein [Mycolicibacterium komossense]
MNHSDDSRTPPKAIDASQFAWEQAAADPMTAARVRTELGTWLRTRFADDERVDDILLAVYEAFANAAEYAYLEHAAPGTVDVLARIDPQANTLTVTVTDHGHWRQPRIDHTDPAHQLRGRGIPLMKALASEASIRTTGLGTQVQLTWRHLLGATS